MSISLENLPENKIERDGAQITIKLHLADDYAAMLAYDRIIQDARRGLVILPFRVEVRDSSDMTK